MTNPDVIRQARAALERSDRAGARQLLTQLIRAPGGATSGEAWWLLGQALDDPTQQQDCLRRAQAAGYSEPAAATAPAGQDDLMSWLAEMSSAPAQPAAPVRAPEPDLPSPPALPEPADIVPEGGRGAFVALEPAPTQQLAAPPEPPPLDLPSMFSAPPQPVAAPAPAEPAAAGRYSQADIDLVIKLLGQVAGHSEVIRAVIMQRDCSVPEAEELVRYVQTQHGGKVAAKKLPLIMMIAVVMLVGGLVALGRAGLMISGGYVAENIGTLRSFVLSLFFGVVLTFGSLFGMYSAVRATRRRR
jgi:hypothetical protein